MNGHLEQHIRERAYHLWLEEGCVHGQAESHWHKALHELDPSLSTSSSIKQKAASSRRTPAPKNKHASKIG